MKTKIVGILVCMLLIASAVLPVVSSTYENDNEQKPLTAPDDGCVSFSVYYMKKNLITGEMEKIVILTNVKITLKNMDNDKLEQDFKYNPNPRYWEGGVPAGNYTIEEIKCDGFTVGSISPDPTRTYYFDSRHGGLFDVEMVKNRSKQSANPILLKLSEMFPNAFPLLQLLLLRFLRP